MQLFIAPCLLIVCGIVDAAFYNQRGQSFNQLNERQQRSVGFPYPYGYRYDPIEPSINVLDSLSETFDHSPDSRINTYQPTYQHVKISTHDANAAPKTHSYRPENTLYDTEYISMQDIPRLMPEDSYDYKYLASPLDKYRALPAENDFAINLLAVRKTQSIQGYGFPTYKSPYLSDSVLNFDSKIPNYMFKDSQSETNPEISKVSSPTVIVVELLPETFEQESTTPATENPINIIFKELLMKRQNALKKSAKDGSDFVIIQETPNEEESNSITTEETVTEDESNSITTEKISIEDEWSSYTTIPSEELNEDESKSTTTEQTTTEDELKCTTIPTEFFQSDELTEEETNSITTEQTPIENDSNDIAAEGNMAEDESNSITTEENQAEDDGSKPTSTQEMITSSEINNKLVDIIDNWRLKNEKDRQSEIKKMILNYNKLREQIKPLFMTVDNISAEFPSNLSSDDNTIQQLQSRVANEGPEMYDEFDDIV